MANINAESAGSALDNLAQVCLVELELKCFDGFHLILWTRSRRRIYLEVTLLKRTRSKPWWLSPPRTMILQSICLTILQFRTDVSFQFRCRYMKIRGQGQVGPVPGNYCCFKCGMPGHWIKQCPLNLVRNYTPLSLFYFNISFLLKLLDDGYQEEHWNSAQFYGACRWARSSWRYDDSIRPFCRSRNRPVRSVLFDFFPVLPTILPTITGTIWNWTIPLFYLVRPTGKSKRNGRLFRLNRLHLKLLNLSFQVNCFVLFAKIYCLTLYLFPAVATPSVMTVGHLYF